MSTPTSLKAYPLECMDILDTMERTPSVPLVLPFPNVAAAKKFQLLFNSFKKLGMTEKEGLMHDYKQMGSLTVRLIKEPPQLVVEHNSHTDVAIGIQQAITQREAALRK